MAKKVRRVRRTASSAEGDRGAKSANRPAAGAASKMEGLEENGSATTTREEELRVEYAYVVKDLRRVAILAAVMFALLILLNLVL